jgi:methanogenic corrinoid protein MtbC1
MKERNESLATILCNGAHALAAYATDELFEIQPQAGTDFGPSSFSAWQSWLAARLEELAAAAIIKQPQRFAEHVRWAKAVLAARGISTVHFRVGLECLRNVLIKELPSETQPLAKDYIDQALEEFDQEYSAVSTPALPDTLHGRMVSAYLLAVLEGDRRKAGQLILEAARQGASVRDLYLEVLFPAQEEIGRMWLTTEINVAEEHFTSATTKMLMAQLRQYATFQPSNGKTILTAAVAGNQHDIGLHAVADFFEMAGWRVIQLGADVPIEDLMQATDFFNADLLGLSVSLSPQLKKLRETIAAVRSLKRDAPVKVLVGGHALVNAGDLPQQFGADAYAPTAADAVAVGNKLVGLPCHE